MGVVKRVLYMYISISGGHQRAAEAVMGAMRQMTPRVAGHGIDAFTYAYPVLGRLVARLYLEVLKYTPQLWNFLYDNPAVEQATRELRKLFGLFNVGKMYRLLKRFRPRCLVCTQAIPAVILSTLKGRGKIKIPVVGILTDFDVHRYWLSRHMDLYLVPSEEIKRKMVRHGIKESRIQVTGIPVDPHFALRGDKGIERLRLGLDPKKAAVLVMGGSRGLGPLADVVSSLRGLTVEVQVIAVCGQNRAAFKALQRRFGNDPAVRIFGLARNMARLMDAADLVVSKPGGLTCAESLAKGLPLVMIQPIPGQEERNARYLLKHGAAERVENLEELGRTVQRLLSDGTALEKLRERAAALARPHAAKEAAEAILKILKEQAPARPRNAFDPLIRPHSVSEEPAAPVLKDIPPSRLPEPAVTP